MVKKSKDFTMSKPRSRNGILFRYDKDDDWFIDVVHYVRKTGEEVRVSHISGRSLEDWINSYISEGWSIDNR